MSSTPTVWDNLEKYGTLFIAFLCLSNVALLYYLPVISIITLLGITTVLFIYWKIGKKYCIEPMYFYLSFWGIFWLGVFITYCAWGKYLLSYIIAIYTLFK